MLPLQNARFYKSSSKLSKMSEHEITKLSKGEDGNYIMRQVRVIKVKNMIGKAFLEKAVPVFTVF